LSSANAKIVGGTRYGQITAIVILLMVLSMLAFSWAMWRIREDTIAASTRSAADVGDMLSQQAVNSIQSIEFVLDELRTDIKTSNVTTAEDFAALAGSRTHYEHLLDRMSRLAQADVVSLIDASGKVLSFTRQ
jgi:hypothetical protein